MEGSVTFRSGVVTSNWQQRNPVYVLPTTPFICLKAGSSDSSSLWDQAGLLLVLNLFSLSNTRIHFLFFIPHNHPPAHLSSVTVSCFFHSFSTYFFFSPYKWAISMLCFSLTRPFPLLSCCRVSCANPQNWATTCFPLIVGAGAWWGICQSWWLLPSTGECLLKWLVSHPHGVELWVIILSSHLLTLLPCLCASVLVTEIAADKGLPQVGFSCSWPSALDAFGSVTKVLF